MSNQKLRGKDLRKINYSSNKTISLAIQVMDRHFKHTTKEAQLQLLENVKNDPIQYLEDEVLKAIAHEFVEVNTTQKKVKKINRIVDNPIPYQVFGKKFIDQKAIKQMDTAMQLPIARKGALMPDAHVGYGIPVGGVLATENEIIPYAVGLDIGCRMSLTIFQEPVETMERYAYQFKTALKECTHFGIGKINTVLQDHEVLERSEFREIEVLKQLHTKAYRQLGTSGSGNHFVEFGQIELFADNQLNVPAGRYLGLLSHSGSRGTGATVANYYTRIAIEQCQLPKGYQHLAWLDLSTEEGQSYWMAMNLAGDYAKACHDVIHKRLAKTLNLKPMINIENHHNFAWKEIHDKQQLVVHRKGATPAAKGEHGIIPGSMTAPGYLVTGKGNALGLHSAAHGAGRKWSRKMARESVSGSEMRKVLKRGKVTLIGGGVDEAPLAYKNLEETILLQDELIHINGKFFPKLVRMDKN